MALFNTRLNFNIDDYSFASLSNNTRSNGTNDTRFNGTIFFRIFDHTEPSNCKLC